MDIEILGTESLGVRGLCCFIKTETQRILIDPGIALGYTRYGLHPHPFQVAVDERIQKRIVKRWSEATDIVFSHFHGDHIPLKDANPYQFNINRIKNLNLNVRVWSKDTSNLSSTQKRRAHSLFFILKNNRVISDKEKYGAMTFSAPVFHGEKNSYLGTVMMTRIEDDCVFVHGSDIQLLNDEAISQILDWEPDILFVDGPPLYLSNRISRYQINRAWHNAKLLSQQIDTLILDHHLMRSYEGLNWLKRLSIETGKKVLCGADFMDKPRMLLEAKRKHLYRDMPVPADWHKVYANGKVTTADYWERAKKLYKSISINESERKK